MAAARSPAHATVGDRALDFCSAIGRVSRPEPAVWALRNLTNMMGYCSGSQLLGPKIPGHYTQKFRTPGRGLMATKKKAGAGGALCESLIEERGPRGGCMQSAFPVPKRLRICPRKSNVVARLVNNGRHQPRQTRLMEETKCPNNPKQPVTSQRSCVNAKASAVTERQLGSM